MDSNNVAVQVEGLSKLDLLELQEAFPDSEVKLHVLDQSEHAYGEPGTIMALIVAGGLVLPTLLLWLSNRREAMTLKEEKNTTLPDGTKVEHRVTIVVKKSSPASAEQIKALSRLNSVDAVIKYINGLSGSDDTKDPGDQV